MCPHLVTEVSKDYCSNSCENEHVNHPTLYLYLIYRIDKFVDDYEIWTNLIVAAEDQEHALRIRPDDDKDPKEQDGIEWPFQLTDLRDKYLGLAHPSIPRGVVFGSYRHG
jgi:hypothetical protein